ncbi:hypothetical protein GX51_07173 [Blastomyces parvus]|uniref:CMP/dCMP-type deaminase domain-containing protein n=1 Tax=Blastomyces parvus TaxID=2060905 RepID=A0A2B7WMG8_9EURO|nr:hypothetical protein GX51_07173 [Blastomyces parvus]
MTTPASPTPTITALTSHKNDLQTHPHYLRACLSLAQQSPPKPTNFRVGAILLSRTLHASTARETTAQTYTDTILSTGYTLELPGNTHAEQCALTKYAASHGVPEERIGDILPPPPSPVPKSAGSGTDTAPERDHEQKIILYVTMEPCGKRLSGNMPCATRIIQTRRSPSSLEVKNKTSHGVDASNGPRADAARRKPGIDKVYFGVKEPGTFVGGSVGCRMLDEAGVEWEVVEGMEEEILRVAMAGHADVDDGKKEGVEDGKQRQWTNIDDISEEERRRQAALPRNPKKRMMEADI